MDVLQQPDNLRGPGLLEHDIKDGARDEQLESKQKIFL
jgi:hypothetical protein